MHYRQRSRPASVVAHGFSRAFAWSGIGPQVDI